MACNLCKTQLYFHRIIQFSVITSLIADLLDFPDTASFHSYTFYFTPLSSSQLSLVSPPTFSILIWLHLEKLPSPPLSRIFSFALEAYLERRTGKPTLCARLPDYIAPHAKLPNFFKLKLVVSLTPEQKYVSYARKRCVHILLSPMHRYFRPYNLAHYIYSMYVNVDAAKCDVCMWLMYIIRDISWRNRDKTSHFFPTFKPGKFQKYVCVGGCIL